MVAAAHLHLGGRSSIEHHRKDRSGTAVTELLAELLFMISNSVLFDQPDEVPRRVARQRGPAEVAIFRKKIFWSGVDIGEVAASSAGYRDFLAYAIIVLQQGHSASTLPGCQCAHHPGRAAA